MPSEGVDGQGNEGDVKNGTVTSQSADTKKLVHSRKTSTHLNAKIEIFFIIFICDHLCVLPDRSVACCMSHASN